MSRSKKFNYSIYVLVIAGAIYSIVVGASRLCMPVLFPEIAADLGLSMVQLGTIWGLDPFAGIFVSLIAGLIVDRFGVRICLAFLCFFGGIFGALRGFAVNFVSMAAIMFFFGLFVAMMPTVIQKTAAIWFPGKRFALVSSILNIAMTFGIIVGTMFSATVFSPLLHGWRNVMFVYGIPGVLLSILWYFTIREPPNYGTALVKQDTTFRQLLSHVIRIKEVWVISLIAIGFLGTSNGVSGYLPSYLREIGWGVAGADGAATVLAVAGAFGGLPLVLLSNRIGSRTKVLIPMGVISVICMLLLPFAHGPAVWILIIFTGLSRSSMFPLLCSVLVENQMIGGKYAGTALGIMMTFNMLGSAICPPLGNSLAGYNPGYPFIAWAVISALGLVGIFFIKEKARNTA